jgi:hypothetical protein
MRFISSMLSRIERNLLSPACVIFRLLRYTIEMFWLTAGSTTGRGCTLRAKVSGLLNLKARWNLSSEGSRSSLLAFYILMLTHCYSARWLSAWHFEGTLLVNTESINHLWSP